MHLKEVKLSFELEHWVTDDDWFDSEPKTVKAWCNKHFLHNHNIKWADDYESIYVSLHNVPPGVTTWIVLSTPNVSILEQVNYAPIAPEVLELFDFGDIV